MKIFRVLTKIKLMAFRYMRELIMRFVIILLAIGLWGKISHADDGYVILDIVEIDGKISRIDSVYNFDVSKYEVFETQKACEQSLFSKYQSEWRKLGSQFKAELVQTENNGVSLVYTETILKSMRVSYWCVFTSIN